MKNFYIITKDINGLPVVYKFLQWLRKNSNQFSEPIKISNTHSPFKKVIKRGFVEREFEGNMFAVKPDENNSIRYSDEFFTESFHLQRFARLNKSKEIMNPVTTFHRFIDEYPIDRFSKKLIIGTIHPHLVDQFNIDFFYGNVGSIWGILNRAFPNIKLGSRDQIIRFLRENKISITDMIRQCERQNEKVVKDSELYNIKINRHQIETGLRNSQIDTIYFTSAFGKNNAAKLFIKTFNLKIDFDLSTREFFIPERYFGRKIKCIVLFSPSGNANVGISKSAIYQEKKSYFLQFKKPVAEFKIQFYIQKFSFINKGK